MHQESLYSLVKKLWNHIESRRRVQIIFLLFFNILGSISEVVSLGAILPFLGALTNPEKIYTQKYFKAIFRFLNINSPEELLFPLTIIFCVAILFSSIIRLLLLWVQTRVSFSVGGDLSYKTYRNTLYQPYSTHISKNTSEIIAGLNKASSLSGNTIMPILTIFNSGLILLMILSTLIFVNPLIAILAVFGFSLIYLIIIQLTKKRLEINSHKISRNAGKAIKALQEGLGGIRDVLIDGTQATYCEIYKNADMPSRQAQADMSFIGGSPRFGIESLGMILIAILAFILSKKNEGIATAIPVLGLLSLGAQRLLPLLQQVYSSYVTLKGSKSSLVDSLELLDQSVTNSEFINDNKNLEFNNNIVLKNLSFQYKPNLPLVLNNLSLEIKKGQMIGIIGTTGSGKSTILDIIMGLLNPTHGNIEVDGIKIDQRNYRKFQSKIAHVPQNIYLADTTIAENIAFGIPIKNINIANIKLAAKKAQISDTIESWEMGYNTNIGERGVRISGGQRQRIGIARALYKNASIIVFDEATSALDNATEEEVMKSIEKIGDDITMIIVAHRLTTLKNCDMIFDIKNGEVVKSGKYTEIINY